MNKPDTPSPPDPVGGPIISARDRGNRDVLHILGLWDPEDGKRLEIHGSGRCGMTMHGPQHLLFPRWKTQNNNELEGYNPHVTANGIQGDTPRE